MALTDFFRINLPYGLKRNEADEWFAFNRERMPLGWNSTDNHESFSNDSPYSKFPVYTTYRGLSEDKILKVFNDPDLILRDDDGKIRSIYLYKDRTNPQSDPKYWNEYLEKIKFLSKFESVSHKI
ncbi:MAG: hypothetical protein H7Y13_03900 [Sphingobacteriaceae bacterium]|nr:hypothetical protein [Sphingobacteriaceae bacterium]